MHYACYTRGNTGISFIFCHVQLIVPIILLTVFNLMLCYIRIGIKLIRMLRRCIIKVYVLSNLRHWAYDYSLNIIKN